MDNNNNKKSRISKKRNEPSASIGDNPGITKPTPPETLPLTPTPSVHLHDNTDLKPLVHSNPIPVLEPAPAVKPTETPTTGVEDNPWAKAQREEHEQEIAAESDKKAQIDRRINVLLDNQVKLGKNIVGLQEQIIDLSDKNKRPDLLPTIIVSAFTGAVIGFGICILRNKKAF